MTVGLMWRVGLFAFISTSSVAAATSVRLVVHAEPGCPSATEVRREVASRLESTTLAEPSQPAVTIELTLGTTDSGATASLGLLERDGRLFTRTVEGASCEEVAKAIALITAMAIDARAREEQSAESLPKEPVLLPSPPEVSVSSPMVRQQLVQLAGEVRPRPRSWLSTGLGLGLDDRYGGRVGLSESMFVGWRHTTGLSLRLGASHARGLAGEEPRRAEFSAWSFRLDGGSVVPLTERLSFLPALGTTLGRFEAVGVASEVVPEVRERSLLWFGLSALGRLGLRAATWLEFELEGAAEFPLNRGDFVFEQPRSPVFRTPSLGFSGTLSAKAEFEVD